MNDRAKDELKPIVNESGIEVKPLYTAVDVEASGGWRCSASRASTPSPAASTA
jgi:hypothetical protein